MRTIFKISVIVLFISSLSVHADIPVLSLDDQGNEISSMISEIDYENSTMIKAKEFAKVAEDQMSLAVLTPHLILKGIMVGLEAQGSLGSSLFKIGAGINQQFYFEIR